MGNHLYLLESGKIDNLHTNYINMESSIKNWYIIDDNLERSISLAEIISQLYSKDQIQLFIVNSEIDDSLIHEIRNNHAFIHKTNLIHSFEDLRKKFDHLDQPGIFLVEVILNGVSNQDLKSKRNPLLQILEDTLTNNKERLISLITTKSNPKRQQQAFKISLQSRVFYDNVDIDEPNDRRNIILKTNLRWEELFLKHPLVVFLDKMASRYSAPQKVNHTLHNHNWSKDYPYPPPQLSSLCDFLGMTAKDFVDEFNIPYTDNAIGECLKVFGTKDKQVLPLLGIILIAYAVFRKYNENPESAIEKQFMEIIKEIIDNYTSGKQKTLYGKICRYQNFLPPQEQISFNKTLFSLYSMFNALFFNDGNMNIAKVKQEGSLFTVFITNMNSRKFVSHLNQYFINLLEKNTIPEHDSIINTRIIEFWLRSNISEVEQEWDNNSPNQVKYWGNSSSFHIESRNEHTIAIIFNISTNE